VQAVDASKAYAYTQISHLQAEGLIDARKARVRGANDICSATAVALMGHDAHCAHGEELRNREWAERNRRVRESESRGVKVLDVFEEQDPDADPEGD
jgi:hypothetical protein